MSYTNANREKTPKKRKVWVDDEHYKEVPVKARKNPDRRYRDEPEPQPDMVLRDQRLRIW